ncbi:hypothetical protein B0H12DRAFT_1234368 [Mycena haematopus]|nr:hypothetical protein B0H12DRAFT_1234368 [Mycena haematopus]
MDGHLLAALRNASNLVDCSLVIEGVPLSTDTCITLPHLRRLCLENSLFLGCLETPALQELYCDYDAFPVLPFLRKQTCKLQKLVLWESYDVPDPDLTPLVEAVPTIKGLALLFPVSIEFLRDLASRHTIAPALEFLSVFLGCGTHSDFDDPSGEIQDQFIEAVESRWRDGRLKSAKLYCTDLKVVASRRLELLRTQGMECVVFTNPDSRSLENVDCIPPDLLVIKRTDYY